MWTSRSGTSTPTCSTFHTVHTCNASIRTERLSSLSFFTFLASGGRRRQKQSEERGVWQERTAGEGVDRIQTHLCPPELHPPPLNPPGVSSGHLMARTQATSLGSIAVKTSSAAEMTSLGSCIGRRVGNVGAAKFGQGAATLGGVTLVSVRVLKVLFTPESRLRSPPFRIQGVHLRFEVKKGDQTRKITVKIEPPHFHRHVLLSDSPHLLEMF